MTCIREYKVCLKKKHIGFDTKVLDSGTGIRVTSHFYFEVYYEYFLLLEKHLNT